MDTLIEKIQKSNLKKEEKHSILKALKKEDKSDFLRTIYLLFSIYDKFKDFIED